MLRTIKFVQTWQLADGVVGLGMPSSAQARHFDEAEAQRLACALEEGDDECFVSDSNDIDVESEPLHPLWWYEESDCAGDAECTCGPVTLLEVLYQLGDDDRQNAMEAHVVVMRDLFDHFWSGQGLLDGTSAKIGDACAACICEGHHHVWGVFEAASVLAEELGEALAAHDSAILLGAARYDPNDRTDPI